MLKRDSFSNKVDNLNTSKSVRFTEKKEAGEAQENKKNMQVDTNCQTDDQVK